MPRHDRALLLHGLRRVPRVPRAQGHTWRKHGRESLQPHVIDEVRHRAGLARLALLRVARGLAARRPRSGPAPGACGCAVAGLCGISAAHHGLSSEQDPRAAICMYCARKCEITYTILTMEGVMRYVCSTSRRGAQRTGAWRTGSTLSCTQQVKQIAEGPRVKKARICQTPFPDEGGGELRR